MSMHSDNSRPINRLDVIVYNPAPIRAIGAETARGEDGLCGYI